MEMFKKIFQWFADKLCEIINLVVFQAHQLELVNRISRI